MPEIQSTSDSRKMAVISDELLAIGERLRTQDNRCTASPMFIVQQQRSFGVEPGEGDMDVWFDEDWVKVDEDTSAKLDELDDVFEWDRTEKQKAFLASHTKRGIKHYWDFVMAAFTEEGCKEYLRLDGHNLTKPRIYAMSFNRCPEMLAIREFLMANASAMASSDTQTPIMNDTEKALSYYRAAVEQARPEYVPSRVRLRKRVMGDGPFRSTFAQAGEHDCKSNQWGAISVMATNGKDLGVKPSEFEVIAWRMNLTTEARDE